jgi:hypothetical protein
MRSLPNILGELMPKKTLNYAEKDRDIQVALNTAPDFSIAFTREVKSLLHAVADGLSGPVEHDDDMNYSAAQKLVVWLDRDCHLLSPRDPKAVYRLIVFVSSRGRFYAFIALGLSSSTARGRENGLEKPPRSWSRITKNNLPDGIKRLQKRIASVMEMKGFSLLDDSVLSQVAEGHWTKLDERPATVFETLFSEMY